LQPFAESDAEVFYGREKLTAELAVKLAAQATRGGIVLVTGASGAGKSSLLHAGLLPKLAQGKHIEGSEHWPRITMTPTKDPLTELATRLAALGGGVLDGDDTVAIRHGLDQHPGEAHMTVRSAILADAGRRDNGRLTSGNSTARLVLTIDQFEQVFTLNPGPGGETKRKAFITALCAAASNAVGPSEKPPALVVIAVRGDFWDRCAAYPELSDAMKGPFVVGPMTEQELRTAITGPATVAGLRIDSSLIDTILGDLHMAGSDDAGVLPLLSQAMALTWERRVGNQLTIHGYDQSGGVSHAVQVGADNVYDALPAWQQTLARDLLRRMTVASRDGRLTRRPVTRADLYTGYPDTDRAEIDAVLEAFAAERLIMLDGDTAQISHDVLLSAWPRLRAWLEDDQASLILYGQFADDAAAWHDNHDDPSFLYRGTQLTALSQAAAQWSANPARYPPLTGTQRDFLHASQRAATRGARQRRSAVAVLAVLAIVASTAAVFGFWQRASAISKRNQAIFSQTVAEGLQLATSDTSLAAQLTLAAYRMQSAPELTSRLLSMENTPLSTAIPGSTGTVYSVAFSPDGRTLATGGADAAGGAIQLWDVADPARPRALGQPLTGSNDAVESVAFSAYGTLATSDDGTIVLWDVANPADPVALGLIPTGSTDAVESVAFSPDGRTLAAGIDNGAIQLWDIADPEDPEELGPPLTASTDTVYSVAFSPDGRTLASGNDNSAVRLWSLPRTALTASIYSVFSVAFSPDGRTLATGGTGGIDGTDGAIQLWDVADPAHPQALGPPLTADSTAGVFSVAFSPDGRTLATGSGDGTIQLWDVADPAHPQALGPYLPDDSTAAVESVAFSPDGRTLATGGTGGNDATIQLWNVADPAHPRAFGPPLTTGSDGDYVESVAFSPDGRALATGDENGRVQLWDVAHPVHPQALGPPLTGNVEAVESVAFSPDGRTLAAGGHGGAVQLWDVASPAHPQALGPPLTTGSDGVKSVAFSPDGRTLATGGRDGIARLWNLNVSYAITWICMTASNDLTPQQWYTYIPQEPYRPPCAH